MPVTHCVLLWSRAGQEAALVAYEDRVLALLERHGGRVLQRTRRAATAEVGADATPYEVQVLEWPDQAAYEAFLADDERQALAPMRDQAVERTEAAAVIDVLTALSTASGDPLPRLVGNRVTLRPGDDDDVPTLIRLLREPSVARWWREPEPAHEIAAKLRGRSYATQLVIEVAGAIAGGIEYLEEDEPDYRHAGIDIFLGTAWQGQGLGAESVGLLATHLIRDRGHHRLTIDPAVANTAAVACYSKVGFRPVGVMRDYERGADGAYHDGLLMDLLAGELAPSNAWQSSGTHRE